MAKKCGKLNLMPNPANLSHKKSQKIKLTLSVKWKVWDKILSWYSHTANTFKTVDQISLCRL